MNRNITGKTRETASRLDAWLAGLSWVFAFFMTAVMVIMLMQRTGIAFSASPTATPAPTLPPQAEAALPEYVAEPLPESVTRDVSLRTIIPDRPQTATQTYEVQMGDSVFSISKQFDIEPETVLWANYDLLNDNPNMLSPGQQLRIPPVDGIIYKVKANDTLEGIAKKYKAKVDDIISWPDNDLDFLEPKLVAGKDVLIPGGSREFQTWVVPTIWRSNSGANKNVIAGCDTSGGSAYGTGFFSWPADNHYLSGNDFWSGHLGIDIAAATGANVYASDSGVVTYAAAIGGGYGLMVQIDHGNGYSTIYAHNSQILVKCGQNVQKGALIAKAGSTGNSTGPHLHFEIRYFGQFINPWDMLP